MFLEEISIENVRNLNNIQLEVNRHTNFFYGKNAAGKTAFLEAIYLIARAKSFRCPRIREVISKNKNSLLVHARLKDTNQNNVSIGIEYLKGETRLSYQGKNVRKVSDQARNLPLFVFTPDSHRIITGNPKERRKWLDIALFHVEQGYLKAWKEYHHALRHRNILLRENASTEVLKPWEKELVKKGEIIEDARLNYLRSLQYKVEANQWQPIGNIKTGYQPVEDLENHLAKGRENDRRIGSTQKGPHRTNIEFFIDGNRAEKILSRGQTKTFQAILTHAQIGIFTERTQNRPILLIDDINTEFDQENRRKVVKMFLETGSQLFINATNKSALNDIYSEKSMFHVKQGKITAVPNMVK